MHMRRVRDWLLRPPYAAAVTGRFRWCHRHSSKWTEKTASAADGAARTLGLAPSHLYCETSAVVRL